MLFPLIADETRWMIWPLHERRKITYSPLEEAPELWRTFVELPEGEEEYLEFANRYGLLTDGVPLDSTDPERMLGVAYSRWLLAHRTLRSVWLVYKAAKTARTAVLSEWIDINEKRARFVGQPVTGHTIRHGAVIANTAFDPLSSWPRHVVATRSTSERLRRLAMLWVWRIVNLCLDGPEAGSRDSLAGDRVTAFLDLNFEDDLRKATVRFRPTSLLGAMWLQFAKTIEGQLDYRQCRSAACRGWFLLSPEGAGKRRHSQFCSERCKLREWRRKRRHHAKTRKG